MPAFSIVIPVYNQWQLTRDCLRSLKATVPSNQTELILVDNASTDVTSKAAPFLGKELFGGNFTYIRNEQNRNFAGASNQGAYAAKGDFLIFLNNDTVAKPGWIQGLAEDFSSFPNLAGTGPLLLYPEKPLLGHTVQHLGVSVSSLRQVGHLYEGIPAASPLVKKRRFFQIITAACLMMPRELFIKAGTFDEEFKNGYEDVDLCVRLAKDGFRFTVNPDARVIHYQGQSFGRRDSELGNSQRLREKAFHLLRFNKNELLHADKLKQKLNPWLVQVVALNPEDENRLESMKAKMDESQILAALVQKPFWRGGWEKIYELLGEEEKKDFAESVFRFTREPSLAISASRSALLRGDTDKAYYWFNNASTFCLPETVYCDTCQMQAALANAFGDMELAEEYKQWANASEMFLKKKLRPFIADFASLARELDIKDAGFAPWAFALDFDIKKENPYGGAAKDFNALEYRKANTESPEPLNDPWRHYLNSLKKTQ